MGASSSSGGRGDEIAVHDVGGHFRDLRLPAMTAQFSSLLEIFGGTGWFSVLRYQSHANETPPPDCMFDGDPQMDVPPR
jgi:hypothetical protein